jgi:hypothetical protein
VECFCVDPAVIVTMRMWSAQPIIASAAKVAWREVAEKRLKAAA